MYGDLRLSQVLVVLLLAMILTLGSQAEVLAEDMEEPEESDYISEFFADRDVEVSTKLNQAIRDAVEDEVLKSSELAKMVQDLYVSYQLGMTVEEADLIARAIPHWERMDLSLLAAAFGEIAEEEEDFFRDALKQILTEAEKKLEEASELEEENQT